MFGVGNQKSFDAIDMWLREVSKYGGEHLQSAALIVGSKADVSKRAISKADA